MLTVQTVSTAPRLDNAELIARWADWLDTTGRSPRTIDTYLRAVVMFTVEHRRLTRRLVSLQELDEDDVVAVLAEIDPKGSGRGWRLRALRSLYGWAIDREPPLVDRNPCRRLRVPKQKYGVPPDLADDELEALFSAAGAIDPRARPALELMYATGARIGSIVGVTDQDVHLDGEPWVRFEIAKGGDPYDVPLGPRAERAARELLALASYVPSKGRRRPNLIGVGEQQLRNWLDRAAQTAGVRAWPHLMRHAFAYRVTNNPAIPDIVAAELLNHKDTSLLLRYARGRDSLKRQAVDV